MEKVFIVGNPNTGKSTLFNNLTKSKEHTGNWHGVTVDAKSKIAHLNANIYEFVDLPGLYSLNAFSYEEKVSVDNLAGISKNIIYIVDANCLKRNMYLLIQLINAKHKIHLIINNYDYFKKTGGSINLENLQNSLGISCTIFNAKKDKKTNLKPCFSYSNKVFDTSSVESIYREIDEIISNSLTKQDVAIYGHSKYDKFILNPIIFFPLFITGIFLGLYTIFFLLGPPLANGLTFSLNLLLKTPLTSILHKFTNNLFVLNLFEGGIFPAVFSIVSFLPQICMLYVFLSLLENSGLIARFAFMVDDFFEKFGLNGKCIYTMLMGFGCNTSAIATAKNMPEKNSRIKTVMITPFMSCSAKLPIYLVIASAILGAKSWWVVLGLYLLGILVAFCVAFVLEKTIIKSESTNFLIEFPPLKLPDIRDSMRASAKACSTFVYKIFGTILGMSVIVWILSHINIKFCYVEEYSQSIVYLLSSKISFIFKPLGFSSTAMVFVLLNGWVAKELILSSIMILNKTTSLQALKYSLCLPTSLITFDLASGVSFLVFVLLYTPCVSSVAVMFKEIGKKYTCLSLVIQLFLAYMVSFLTYNLFILNYVKFFLVLIILFGIFMLCKGRIKNCSNCIGCDKRYCRKN